MKVDPWTVEVSGAVRKPGELNLEDILSGFDLQEHIYRLRCVEAWSMVVPWVGFPLAELLQRFEPVNEARYPEFETLYRPQQLRGTRSFTSIIDWPYREGLRMDEANASAYADGGGSVRQDIAQLERRPDSIGRTLEIRFQEHQIHCPDPPDGETTRHFMAIVGAADTRPDVAGITAAKVVRLVTAHAIAPHVGSLRIFLRVRSLFCLLAVLSRLELGRIV